MKIVFLTNFLTHHQTPFCEEMYKHLGADFRLIVMRSADPEQKKLGYKELNDIYPYVLRVYDGTQQEREAMTLCAAADVVILGAAPLKYIEQRRKQNKLTFIYTERLFKRGYIHALHPAVLKMMFQKFTSQRKKKQYYLCASAYTAPDINWATHTPEKFFKWGYFPETKRYDDVNALIDKKKKNSLVWVGRFIDWKHPEIPIEVAKCLKQEGYKFTLNMLGNGVMLDSMKALVDKYDLTDCVHILGAKPSGEVRQYMEEAEIHLVTSDRNEGWGAVLNEGMNSACAIVANRQIGSVPFLIDNEKNGLVYKNKRQLYQKVKHLLDRPEERTTICKNAYETMVQQWNAKTASERLLNIIDRIQKEELLTLYETGPCSIASVL